MIQKPFRGAQLNRTHPLVKGLVGCWLFNEATGETVFDLSGNGNNGTLENDVAWGSSGLDFGGVDGYISLPNLNINGSTPRTMSFWVKPKSGADIDGIFSCGANSPLNKFNIYSDVAVSNNVYVGSNSADWYSAANTLPEDEISKVDVVYNGGQIQIAGNLKIYINAVDLPLTFAGAGSGVLNTSNVLYTIGTDIFEPPGRYLDGSIYSASTYNRALSADEIAWSYREPYAMFEPSFNPALLYSAAPPVGAIWYYNMLRRRNR